MTAIVMDGNALRDEIVAGLANRIAELGSPEVCLATVLVGDDGPSQRYVSSKHKKAAEAGIGIVMLPSFILGEALRSGRLVEVLPDREPVLLGIHALYPQGPFPQPKLRAFVDHVVAAFSDGPPWERGAGGAPWEKGQTRSRRSVRV